MLNNKKREKSRREISSVSRVQGVSARKDSLYIYIYSFFICMCFSLAFSMLHYIPPRFVIEDFRR